MLYHLASHLSTLGERESEESECEESECEESECEESECEESENEESESERVTRVSLSHLQRDLEVGAMHQVSYSSSAYQEKRWHLVNNGHCSWVWNRPYKVIFS